MSEIKYNQYKAMLAIAKASFRSILRSPSAVVFTLVFPLIFIMVFGFLGGNGIRLDVAVSPVSDRQNEIFDTIVYNPAFNLIFDMNQQEQQVALQKGKIDAILEVKSFPSNSGKKYQVNLYTSLSSAEKGMISRSLLEHIVDRYNLRAAHVNEQMAELKPQLVQGRAFKTIDFILPGQLGFSLLSSGVFGTAFVFFNLRQTLVIKRFFATPIRKPFIVLGEALSRLVFSLLGAAFLLLLGHFVFGFTLIHGLTTFLMMLLLSAIGLIVFMGFGFVVSGIAKSESTIPPLANIVTLPQFLLSGTFFSIDNFPTWLQPICKALPLTYLNDAMRKVAFEGAGFAEIATPLLIIIGWGILIYAIAVKVFRWE
ncbi:ABC transporter permease [soil metagenome]